MFSILLQNSIRSAVIAALLVMTLTGASFGLAGNGTTHSSKPFMGAKANTGTVTHTKEGTKNFLTLSDDFKVPDTPAPHWQIVDSKGNVYLLQRLMIKGDKYNRRIEVPAYIKDIAKVQIWCAWAETLLGETSFDRIVKL
jgi:hypothetical protein